ncbi:MAG TPA: copper chaperone PCu(A)C [Candidatus Eisenbacteria bacterium]
MRAPLAAAALTLAAASILGLTGAAGAGDAAAPPSGVVVRDAWARATPAGATMGAIYLTLESAAGDRLVGAAVPHSVAAATEIHETVMLADSSGSEGGGRMTMRPVAAIELPAGEPVELKPGGYHIMLFDLKKPLKPGAHVTVTLVLEKAGKRKVTATVREG